MTALLPGCQSSRPLQQSPTLTLRDFSNLHKPYSHRSKASSRLRRRKRSREMKALVEDESQEILEADEDSESRTSLMSHTTHTTHTTRYSQSSMRTSGMLSDVEYVDQPMSIHPWCGKCPPLRPYSMLPLRPDAMDVVTLENRKWRSIRNQSQSPQSLDSLFSARSKKAARANWFEQSVSYVVSHPPPGRKKLANIQDIQLCEGPAQSKFSDCLCTVENMAPVFHRLTWRQIGLLECWAIHHVKIQRIQDSAIVHAMSPRAAGRHRSAIRCQMVCQLLQRQKESELDETDWTLLLGKLASLPFFCDIPSEMLREVARSLVVTAVDPGSEIIRPGDAADKLYVLIQGEVEVASGSSNRERQVVEAPWMILAEHIFITVASPYFLRKPKQRIHSQTVVGSMNEENETPAMLLVVPLKHLQMISKHFESNEIKERRKLVAEMFAPAVRLAPQVCTKRLHLFEKKTFSQHHVLMQQGAIPELQTADIIFIVEGEVKMVRTSGHRTMRVKVDSILAGPRQLIGNCVLYGESYTHSAVVSSEHVQVLTLNAAAYLEKLLNQTFPLKRPPDYEKEEPQDVDPDHSPKSDPARLLMSMFQKSTRQACDMQKLKSLEWKVLCHKDELPKPRSPHSSLFNAPFCEAGDRQGPPDLCYPRDCDLFPHAQKSVLGRA